MKIDNFPSIWSVPSKLLSLDGNCGPIAVWGVLRYFKKRISSRRIIKMCRHTQDHGSFTIALALALRERGLSVDFFTEPDKDPHPIERACYRRAGQLGIQINEAISLEAVLTKLTHRTIPILFFDTAERTGHFSPLTGIDGDNLILPYSQEGFLSKEEFSNRWNGKGVLKQCLVASL